MQPNRMSQIKTKVDQILAEGDLSEDAQEALIEVLTPDPYEQTWPDVTVVLYIAEHPVVAQIMRDGRLPEPLETALVEAFSAVMPLLGTRAFGPLIKFAERARRRLDAESKKYEMVAGRLAKLEDEDAKVGLLRDYLSTKPAPLFVARFRQQHPSWVDDAEEQSRTGADLEVLDRDADLVHDLEHPRDADADEVAQKLEALGNQHIAGVTLRRALAGGTAPQKLVAAALVTAEERVDFAPTLLGLVLAGDALAPHLAVMAGRLAPMIARQVFSQFLADAAWMNPEEREAEITAERTHAVLSARCMLPKVGSPMPQIADEELPPSMDTDQLRAVPGLIEHGWALWERL